MNSTQLTMVCLLALALAHLAAPWTARSQSPAQLEKWLREYPAADANKDGKLTVEEAHAYHRNVLLKQEQANRSQRAVRPTHANVQYGAHPRNVFDLWLPTKATDAPDSGQPRPVFVYFHGGGFVAGDKSGFNPTAFLEDGMAVVSANYRFVNGKDSLSPAPLLDAARVIQHLRRHAPKWKLDEKKIAVSGNSAGAVIAMWLGYHDDIADAKSDDLLSRQSSRVACIAPLNGPSNLDPFWIRENLGGPKHVHGSFPKMFGVAVDESKAPKVMKRIIESSPMHHVNSGDAPTLSIYNGRLEGIPLPESASTGLLIHHPHFGYMLQQKLNAAKVPNKFLHGVDPRKDGYAVIRNWLNEQGF